MRNILFAALLTVSMSAFAQTSITCDSILQTSTCAGGNVIIPFQTTGSFPWGNVFTAELSDVWGNWGSPVSLGTTMFVVGGNGIIFGTIPANANFGIFYRVRIVSSNPADTSSDSPNTLIVTQVAQLNQIVSNPGDSACPGDTITLYALNLASEYLWSTGDTTASIQVTTSGVYSVTTTDALTCESTAYDTIVFDPSFCTGIAEEQTEVHLHIYPNPASGFLTVQYDGRFSADASYEISDASGKLVSAEKIQATGSQQQQISLKGLAPGMYFFKLRNNGRTSVTELIVE
jgi:hypothetical protein